VFAFAGAVARINGERCRNLGITSFILRPEMPGPLAPSPAGYSIALWEWPSRSGAGSPRAFAVTGGWLYSPSFFSHLMSQTSMERILENAMYASRWLLAPIYFGLSLGLLALALKFFQEVVHVLPNVFPSAKPT
jgi:hypothetical protein